MLIKNIKHNYREFSLDIKDLLIKKNEIIGLVGENGAGKTTLMSIIAEHIHANERFEIDNFIDTDEILFIPSNAEVYNFLTVQEFLEIVSKYSVNNLSVSEMLELLDLQEKKDCIIEELSQGMRKKLTLIPLFIKNYKLILLDEPFNSIDLNYIYKLKILIKKLKNNSSIIISSHIIDTLVDLCDSFILISNGKLVKTFSNSGNIREIEGELFDTDNKI